MGRVEGKGKQRKKQECDFLDGGELWTRLSGAVHEETLKDNHQSPQACRPLPTTSRQFLNCARKKRDLSKGEKKSPEVEQGGQKQAGVFRPSTK